MSQAQADLTPERRAMLSLKGRLLYGKYCGTRGRGICAEGFAAYHLGRGEVEVVDDFLAFLETQVAALRVADPQGRLGMTEALLARVRRRVRLHAVAGEFVDA